MDKTKKCPFCKESMRYVYTIEVSIEKVRENGVTKRIAMEYPQYGWICRMKEDPCDVIFDEEDRDKNLKLYKEACEKRDCRFVGKLPSRFITDLIQTLDDLDDV